MSTATAAAPSATATKPRTYGWIISPAWDLTCFVLTPLLIIPLVLGAQQFYSARQIWLVAVAFFSVGHHLPGFLRAYGDRDLFARFRWRLLIVPPLIFSTAWWFESHSLHGLRVVILLWATWHGLMQTYGFMRIYDLKRGIHDATAAWLDFWLCVSVFVAGTVFSGARMYGLISALWESGVPAFGPGWVLGLRVASGLLLAGVLLAYVWNLLLAARRPVGITWNKVLLAVSTAGIWWLCGAAFTNTLVGVAMFEIFHAVQYLAIVWVFHRKTFDRWSESSGAWGTLFAHRGLVLAGYLGLIALFGAGRYFSEGNIQDQQWLVLVLSLLSTSTLLHYYFDGFIWKVREPQNQQQLDVEGKPSARPLYVPALWHVTKWALFFVPLGTLMAAEAKWPLQDRDPTQQVAMARTLATVAPQLPQARIMLAQALWPAAQSGSPADMQAYLNAQAAAVRLAPERASLRYNLAGALRDAGQWEAAEKEYHQALATAEEKVDIERDLDLLYVQWSAALCDARQFAEAAQRLRDSQHPLAPHVAARIVLHADNKLKWAQAIRSAALNDRWQYGMQQFQQAFGALNQAAFCLSLGEGCLHFGQEGPAESALEQAVKLDPQQGRAHYLLGMLLQERSQLAARAALPTFDDNVEARARQHLAEAQRLGYKPPAKQ